MTATYCLIAGNQIINLSLFAPAHSNSLRVRVLAVAPYVRGEAAVTQQGRRKMKLNEAAARNSGASASNINNVLAQRPAPARVRIVK